MTRPLTYIEQLLALGDSDKTQVWGGRYQPSASAKYIESLQRDLTVLGIYRGIIDGNFGEKTEQAVQLFQWNATYNSHRLQRDQIIRVMPTLESDLSGKLDKTTAQEIDLWLKSKFRATGDLVRLDIRNLPGFQLSRHFVKLDHPSLGSHECFVSSAMIPLIEHANQAAIDLGLTIVLNQTFRLEDSRVKGAVVPPAKRSLHLIGHAIDGNIVEGDEWNSSQAFALNQETANARKFIDAMKEVPLVRWGGDFQPTDTPHFDILLSGPEVAYDCKRFFNQMSLRLKQSIQAWGHK